MQKDLKIWVVTPENIRHKLKMVLIDGIYPYQPSILVYSWLWKAIQQPYINHILTIC